MVGPARNRDDVETGAFPVGPGPNSANRSQMGPDEEALRNYLLGGIVWEDKTFVTQSR